MYYLAGKGQIIQLCPLPQISSGLTDPDNKKTNTTLKLVGKAGSTSRLDSSLLKRGRGERSKCIHLFSLFCFFFAHFSFHFKDRATMRDKEVPTPLATLVGITLREL